MPSPVLVRSDDRLRLAGSLLAASDWPEREQAAKAYKPHRVAEQAQRRFAPHRGQAAVAETQRLVGAGEGLERLYAYALRGDWPAALAEGLPDFKAAAQPEAFWADTEADWTQAEADARVVLARADLAQFLGDLFGPLDQPLVFVPNLLFPGRQSLAVADSSEVVVCAPPPKAWGTSPPWRYHERPDEVLAGLAEAFARRLFLSRLADDQAAWQAHAGRFALAAAVLFLRQAEGEAAGDQFMIMEKRTRGLPDLPAVVGALQAALDDRRSGKYAGFGEYVADFVAQLPAGG